LKDDGLAEDAVHEIFLKLWLKREILDSKLSVKSFLYTCLKNHILNAVRTKKNEILKHIRISHRSNNISNTTENTFISSEYQALIQTTLNTLPEKKQTIFRLSIFKGWSNEKIAEELKIPLNTVKMYLSQSTRLIKSLLKEK
jgi:RNA polymerase sigma-70 factor (ECF subfamily)